ncbi:MAG: hypothetical protein INH41_11360 [Myxococcaceae bacterium]|nr:hypothetical protein [Myxococcaceae bacterium]
MSTAALSMGVGFGLGALVFREPTRALEAPPPTAAATPPPSRVQVVERERRAAVPLPAPPPPVEVPSPRSNEASSTPGAVEALEAKVEALERQLTVERQLRAGTEGERGDAPTDLPRRFTDQRLLLQTFNAGLKAAGFADAQVENIDCTEHPCIVYGHGFGERHDLQRLRPFLGPFQQDDFSTFGFVAGEGPSARRFFGVAVMPDDASDALDKRINHRVRQMYEASMPPRAGGQTQ